MTFWAYMRLERGWLLIAIYSALISGLLFGFAVTLTASHNYQQAYETTPAIQGKDVVVGHGRLRHDPKQAVHIMVGYVAENCTVETPSASVIAYNDFTVNEHSNAPAIVISAPATITGGTLVAK